MLCRSAILRERKQQPASCPIEVTRRTSRPSSSASVTFTRYKNQVLRQTPSIAQSMYDDQPNDLPRRHRAPQPIVNIPSAKCSPNHAVLKFEAFTSP